MTTEDQTRYMRAQFVVLDVFANTMRDLLKDRYPFPSGLAQMTGQDGFKKRLTIDEEDMTNSIINGYDGLDIGLMYKIFRFFKIIYPPTRGWGYVPIESSTADDLERIRIFRNVLMHKTKPTLTQDEMDSMFKDFNEIAKRFDVRLKKSYVEMVEKYKTGVIDPDTEKKYENELTHIKEKYSVEDKDKRITIHFGRPIQDLFDYPQRSTRLKVYLPGIIDPANVIKVLTTVIMELVKTNNDIILDNFAEGSLVLYVTAQGNAMRTKEKFLQQIGCFVLEIITKADVNCTVPGTIDAVLVMSDPLVDNLNHKLRGGIDNVLFDGDSSDENVSDEDSSSKLETTTFRMAEARLDSKGVEKALVEQAAKHNSENIKKELRLIIIGKIGVGKSALGNWICGKDEFPSEDGSCSVTRSCAYARCFFNERRVILIDTPGIFGTEHDSNHVEMEIRKCIGLGCPGPNAILFVMTLADRFKMEDNLAIREFLKFFGKSMLNHVIVVFTHADKLIAQGISFKDHIDKSPSMLKDLLQSCGNRYVCLNTQSKDIERTEQLNKLFTTINELRLKNFEDENFKATEKMIAKLEEEKKDEIIRRIEKLEEIIQTDFETVMNDTLEHAFKRLKSVRDDTRTDIEHNQAQYVVNASKLKMHKSIDENFTK